MTSSPAAPSRRQMITAGCPSVVGSGSVLANASCAAVPIHLDERFPTRLRATATALVWNGGFAIGGLMTTFVSLASPAPADIPDRLAIFLAVCVALFLVGAALSPETRGGLDRDGEAASARGAGTPAQHRSAAA